MNSIKGFRALVLVGSAFAAAIAYSQQISVGQPWIRAAPPTAMAMAGYLSLANTGEQPMTLRAIHAMGFHMAELHETLSEGGVMKMRPVPELVIGPGKTATLAPGGMHLMLMHPDRVPAVGEKIPVTLEFAGAPPMTIEFVVLSP